MAKRTKYPRLRTKVYKGKSGQAYVYYVYDMRPEGKPDVRLGKDYGEAVRQWEELHHNRPRIVGRIEEAFARFEAEVLPKYESTETKLGYKKNLRTLRPVFGGMVWDEVDLPTLRLYLDKRTAKTQGNREMALLRIVWGKALLWGMTRLPWPATGVRGWRNGEQAREFEVTLDLFTAVYAQADQVLRDAMDIASALGLRVTDARSVRMPVDGLIKGRANKTKKALLFRVAESPVLSAIVARREAMAAYSPYLLTSNGRQVSYRMLQGRWNDAREAAAYRAEVTGNPALGERIRAMWLRDMRSLAADLSPSLEAASKLLQHSDQRLTEKHYRNKAETLSPVR